MMKLKSKTEQVVDILIERIKKGIFLPGMKLPSEQKLHEQIPASAEIIKRALNILKEEKIIVRKSRTGSFVTSDALERIYKNDCNDNDEIIKIGFALHHRWARDVFFQEIVKTLKVALPGNIELKVYFQNFLRKEVYLQDNVKMIFVDHGYSDVEIDALNELGIYVVTLLRKRDHGNYLCFDNYSGGYQIGQLLGVYGHKSIVQIDYRNDSPDAEGFIRRKGLQKAAEKFKMTVHNIDIAFHNSAGGFPDIRTAITYLFSSNWNFSAIIALDDDNAYFIYDILQDMNISVPGDVSLIGFNDNYYSSLQPIPLTTISFSPSRISQMLMQAIEEYLGSGNREFKHTVVPTLMARNSVKIINNTVSKPPL